MDGVENIDESSNFTQWVANNVDHNINTLTGKGTFHGMGIISVTQTEKITSDKLVTRIQKRKTSEVIKNKGIKIQSFLGSSSKGLSNIKLKPVRQLTTSYTFLPEIKYNILWHAGWFTSSPENPRSNWSGFMQVITDVPVCEQKSSVSFLPIIDLNQMSHAFTQHCLL